MDDGRVWAFERDLWVGEASVYPERMDESVIAVVPAEPFVLEGEAAIRFMQGTPRWDEAEFAHGVIARPEEGLIVVAYHVRATREGHDPYEAWCSSTYRRIAHEDWTVVQHQQTPPLRAPAAEREA